MLETGIEIDLIGMIYYEATQSNHNIDMGVKINIVYKTIYK